MIEEYIRRVHDGSLDGFQFEGLFCNAVEPWGEKLIRAPVVLGGQRQDDDGSIRITEVLDASDPLLNKVLTERWPADLVLGARRSDTQQQRRMATPWPTRAVNMHAQEDTDSTHPPPHRRAGRHNRIVRRTARTG